MLEVLGGLADPDHMHPRVDDKTEGIDFLEFLVGYARRLKGEERQLARDMAIPYLPKIVPLVTTGTIESRGFAVQILALLGMPLWADEVALALEDESPVVAMIAARSLCRPGQEEYFPKIVEHLPRFAHWSRTFLAGLLANAGPAVIPLLRDVLGDRNEQPIVRAIAGDALCELNDIEAPAVAVRILRTESDRDLAASCLRILRKLGHRDHLPIVRKLLASLDPVVRATAAATLGAIGGPEDIRLLRDRLDDPFFWASLEAARGILALGGRETLQRAADSSGQWSTLAQQVLAE